MRALLLASLLLLPAAAWAQDAVPSREARADLDGDGVPESYRLEDAGDGVVDLWVEASGEGARYPDVAWTSGMAGQEPGLEVSPGGSLRIVSMNDAVGRDRWTLALTVAHRDGALRVAGVTFAWRDTLDPEGWGTCDLNLLTGAGTLTTALGTRAIAAPRPAPLLADWAEAAMLVPSAACEAP